VLIHPTAFVSPQADIGARVEIGPFAIVEAGAKIADECRLLSHAIVKSGTSLGMGTVIGECSVIGGLPQHKSAPAEPGTLVIGARNVIREHVTIHRAMHAGHETVVGDDCLLMVGAHVAHDCHVGNQVILTNGVMLGGHVEVGDRACFGGNAAVHQFCRVGRLAMVGGCTKLVQDVPPFVLTDGPGAMIVGLNRVGLRRAGLDRHDILQLKSAYRLIYRQGLTFDAMVAALERQFPSGVAAEFTTFFQSGQRGFVQERRSPPRVALRVHPAVDDAVDEVFEELPAIARFRKAG
jgi:UDP-N-acetylglucosamine acyltransferase